MPLAPALASARPPPGGRASSLPVPGRYHLQEAQAIARGVTLAKRLANLPGNICTPTFLAQSAIDLGKKQTFTAGMYACRPPGMLHGPYRVPKSCMT